MLKTKLETLPMQPGCYLMKDKYGEVIYVGKAKKLKNRVTSYFHGSHNNKTTKLVQNIVDFDFIVTPSEKEAFILEFNLIKKYKPKFNIMFMDDASYPYIRLSKEKYPTLKVVRDRKRMKNATYYGPFPITSYARSLCELLGKLYPLRKCDKLPSKVCLYYHLGLCLGPCEFEVEESKYEEISQSIRRFMNGDTKEIVCQLIKERDLLSNNLEFEKAANKQELIQAIENITANQIMQANRLTGSQDVFNYIIDKGYISIVGLLYDKGKLLHRHLLLKPLYNDEDGQDIFLSYLVQYYNANELPKQLVLPNGIDITGLDDVLSTEIIQPIRGDKVKLIELAKENAKIQLEQKFEIINKENTDNDAALQQLANALQCNTERIELYDNSHISGSNAVAGEVVYIDGKPSKKDYRLYKVSNENNDFANMQEVLYRRLFKSLKENTRLPDLILVDGGISQINAAKQILNNLHIDCIKLAGLVKNDKHATASLMDENHEIIELDKESKLFYMLTNMQDEVHRFAISYHKRLRDKEMSESIFDEINGVGEKKKSLLLRKFKSLNKIKSLSVEELHQVVDIKTANNIYDFFHNNKQEENTEFDIEQYIL